MADENHGKKPEEASLGGGSNNKKPDSEKPIPRPPVKRPRYTEGEFTQRFYGPDFSTTPPPGYVDNRPPPPKNRSPNALGSTSSTSPKSSTPPQAPSYSFVPPPADPISPIALNDNAPSINEPPPTVDVSASSVIPITTGTTTGRPVTLNAPRADPADERAILRQLENDGTDISLRAASVIHTLKEQLNYELQAKIRRETSSRSHEMQNRDLQARIDEFSDNAEDHTQDVTQAMNAGMQHQKQEDQKALDDLREHYEAEIKRLERVHHTGGEQLRADLTSDGITGPVVNDHADEIANAVEQARIEMQNQFDVLLAQKIEAAIDSTITETRARHAADMTTKEAETEAAINAITDNAKKLMADREAQLKAEHQQKMDELTHAHTQAQESIPSTEDDREAEIAKAVRQALIDLQNQIDMRIGQATEGAVDRTVREARALHDADIAQKGIKHAAALEAAIDAVTRHGKTQLMLQKAQLDAEHKKEIDSLTKTGNIATEGITSNSSANPEDSVDVSAQVAAALEKAHKKAEAERQALQKKHNDEMEAYRHRRDEELDFVRRNNRNVSRSGTRSTDTSLRVSNSGDSSSNRATSPSRDHDQIAAAKARKAAAAAKRAHVAAAKVQNDRLATYNKALFYLYNGRAAEASTMFYDGTVELKDSDASTLEAAKLWYYHAVALSRDPHLESINDWIGPKDIFDLVIRGISNMDGSDEHGNREMRELLDLAKAGSKYCSSRLSALF